MSSRHEPSSRRRIQNQQDATHEPKDEHRARQHILCGEPSDERSYQDAAYALERLVQPCQDTYSLKGNGDVCLLFKFVVAVRGERDYASVESLEPKFIHHNAGDVNEDVAALGRGVESPCFADDGLGMTHFLFPCSLREQSTETVRNA